MRNEEFPWGLRCAICHREILDGQPYKQALEYAGPDGDSIDLLLCVYCSADAEPLGTSRLESVRTALRAERSNAQEVIRVVAVSASVLNHKNALHAQMARLRHEESMAVTDAALSKLTEE